MIINTKNVNLKNFLILGSILLLTLGLTACNTNKINSDSSIGNSNQNIVISAGYISYSPGFIVNPNTKEKSGIFHDILEEIAKRKNITIEYAEEVTRGTMIESLNTNRVDVIANPVWSTDERLANAELSSTVYYSPIGAYTRADDNRFTSIKDINDPSIRIAAVDGEGGQVIAKTQFADATLVSFPNTVDLSQMLLEIESKKEDVTFMEPIFAYEYMKSNPGKLKNIAKIEPVKQRRNSYMLKKGNTKLLNLINEGLSELMVDGTVDKIISKYEPFSGAIIRVQ